MRSKDDILAIKELEGTVAYLQRHYEDVVEERDKAHAEVEQLKQALHDARLENSGQAALLERRQHIGEVTEIVRPEPSRLEIAAMIYAGSGDHGIASAFVAADKLIAVAKEGK
jgi:hypothetical protein